MFQYILNMSNTLLTTHTFLIYYIINKEKIYFQQFFFLNVKFEEKWENIPKIVK